MGSVSFTHLILLFVILAFSFLPIAGMWKIFEKAGIPGWYALIPILNVAFLFEVSGLSKWFVIFMVVPFLNFFAFAYLSIKLCDRFQISKGNALGLIFLPWVFLPMLGFSQEYTLK